MQNQGYVRKFFLGANTYKGFHSYYEYVVPGIPKKLFILKGGPGTGKSTFLRKIANEFINMGHDIEMHHCSSDNDSLDAIRIVPFNIAVMDGTAPHTTDPKYPAVVDEIINLGEYWNNEGIEKNGKAIINCNRELKKLYASSYRFLNGAKEIQDDFEALMMDEFDWPGFNNMLSDYKQSILKSLVPKNRTSKVRHLFHSSINSAGRVDFVENAMPRQYTCHYIKGQYLTAATNLINTVLSDFILKGYDVEIFHQPLNPERLDTIVVNELNLVITNDANLKNKAERTLDLDNFINKIFSAKDEIFIEKDEVLMNKLIDEAIVRIQAAKLLHDKLERYYIESMDFKRMSDLRNNTIDRIKNICK